MKFGTFIKEKRLARKLGLRIFAAKIGVDAGNWCRVEKSRSPAPSDIKILNKICQVLNFSASDREKMLDLAAKESKEKVPADIKDQIKENEIVPILFRTIDKKNLTKEQLKQLVKRIRDEY